MDLFDVISYAVRLGITLCLLLVLGANVNAQMINPVLVRPQTQVGVTNGNGLQIFSTPALCTPPASIGGSCISTITMPVTMNDTSYNILCWPIFGAETVGLGVGLSRGINLTTTSFDVIVSNLSGFTPNSAFATCLVSHQ